MKRLVCNKYWLFWDVLFTFPCVCNHVKLEICSFIMIFNSGGFSKCTVLCGGYWLWALQISGGLQTCMPKGWKYQMIKRHIESHHKRSIVWTNQWQIWVSFSFKVCWGKAGIYLNAFVGFLKLSSSGLATELICP